MKELQGQVEAYGARMTSCESKSKKVTKTHKITVAMCNRSPVIKARGPLFMTTLIP